MFFPNILNENLLSVLIKYIDFRNYITFVTSSKTLLLFDSNDYLWKLLSYKYKNNFYWELASLRTQCLSCIKCDKNLSWKDQIKSIFNYEKIVDNTCKTDISYYILWVNQELILGCKTGANLLNATYMLNRIYEYYNNQIYLFIDKHIKNKVKSIEIINSGEILSSEENLNYIKKFVENKTFISRFIFKIKINFLEQVFKKTIDWELINQICIIGRDF